MSFLGNILSFFSGDRMGGLVMANIKTLGTLSSFSSTKVRGTQKPDFSVQNDEGKRL